MGGDEIIIFGLFTVLLARPIEVNSQLAINYILLPCQSQFLLYFVAWQIFISGYKILIEYI